MACENESFCNNYMLVNAGEAGCFDLGCLLFSSKYLEKKRFINFPDDQQWQQDFPRRWLIFVSLLLQKLFILFRKPMKLAGNIMETWLNLVSTNGGPFMLLLNLFTGKLQWPDRSSATFRSVVGNIDRRIELDASIKREDVRYIPSLAIMAAKLSYESENHVKTVVQRHWMMEFLGFYNFWNDYQQRFSTQAFIARDTESEPDLIVVAFRGTDPFDADGWSTDVDISWFEIENVGKIHAGFMKALGLQKDRGWPKEIQRPTNSPPFAYYSIRQILKRILQDNDKAKFIVTGHSLGGSLAILFVAVLMLHEEEWLLERLDGVYTFGQPRVGDKKFGEFMEEKLRKYSVRYCRCVYCNDIVPRLPYDDKTLFFKHFGPSLFVDSFYNCKVTWQEENKNYFSLLWAIPKRVNAVWELIRSFILPIAKGPDYKETWFLRVIRVIGLVTPGLANHCAQDYVNATRLGSF